MSAYEVLENISAQQGWNDESKIDLLCRFIDNLDILCDHTEEMVPDIFESWLQNKADWENDGDVCSARQRQIDDIVKKLEEAGKTAEDLDDLVHDLYAEMAAASNNTDLEGQVEDLLDNGVSPKTILGVIGGS